MSRNDSELSPLWLPWLVFQLIFVGGWLLGPVPLPVQVVVVGINIAAFVLYKVDKDRAIRGEWRIPETWLFAVTLCGGMMGADLARKLFNHKTRKFSFKVCMGVAFFVQLYAMLIIAGAPVLPWQANQPATTQPATAGAGLHNPPHHHHRHPA
ncbi:DUF1294 domain-containing protein [Paraburkholderia sp. EG287A]|uniref:DUF1294 domain-containing protein n=1 Tax=Paraburkholderia sp. EG287A TaxID=3237012 RepID=UPI0034D338F5